MALQVGRYGFHGIALHQLESFEMRHRIERFLKSKHFSEVLLVIVADRERSIHGLAELAVLFAHALEAGESIKTDDLAMPVERFENAAERREQRERLAPADTKFHHSAVGAEDLPVDLIEE